MKQADRIRHHALTHHVVLTRGGSRHADDRVGDVCRDMGLQNRVPNVCSALRSRVFLDLAGLEFLERIGPNRARPRVSTTTQSGDAPARTRQQSLHNRRNPQTPARVLRVPPRSRRAAERHPNLVVVIQCAASKDRRAGHLIDKNGSRALFVAQPAEAPYNRSVVYRRPDDSIRAGRTWRDALLEYNNRRGKDNPMGLLPAWQLYDRPVYRELVHALGAENVFILSAGWGSCPRTSSRRTTTSRSPQQPIATSADERWTDIGTSACSPVPHRTDRLLGGKDYVPLFQSVTESIRGTRIIFYNSAEAPDGPDCVCVRFETRTGTNWHYECARALIQGALEFPV